MVVPKQVISGLGGLESGAAQAHQDVLWNASGDRVRVMSDALSSAGMDEGPGQWYYQLSRTLPEMLGADAREFGRQLRREFERTWWNPRNWKWR